MRYFYWKTRLIKKTICLRMYNVCMSESKEKNLLQGHKTNNPLFQPHASFIEKPKEHLHCLCCRLSWRKKRKKKKVSIYEAEWAMSGPFHLLWVFFCRRIQGVQFLLCVEMWMRLSEMPLMYAKEPVMTEMCPHTDTQGTLQLCDYLTG